MIQITLLSAIIADLNIISNTTISIWILDIRPANRISTQIRNLNQSWRDSLINSLNNYLVMHLYTCLQEAMTKNIITSHTHYPALSLCILKKLERRLIYP